MTFAIYQKLGGEDVVLEIVRPGGFAKKNSEMARQWALRGKIPGDKAARLMHECFKRGIATVWPDDFIAAPYSGEGSK